jgi:hypothetical protein
MAMEQGCLHVDAINQCGRTLAVVYIMSSGCLDFDPVLWDKYWEMGPDVATFWSAMPTDLLPREADILIHTPALWADLDLVPAFAKKNSRLRGEVHRRMKASLRFAWMAAVAGFEER